MINVDGQTVTVNPDLLTVEESHVEDAREKGLDVPMSADRIKQAFASAPDVIRRRIKSDAWLIDDHIHYVTSDEMGAAMVLDRRPTGETDVATAKKRNSGLFLQGASVTGLRLGLDIFVQESERGTGVEVHEAVHLLSGTRRGLLDMFGQDFNEGVTEVLTRLVVAPLIEGRDRARSRLSGSAQGRRRASEAGLFSLEELAAGYFDGDLRPLFSGTARAMAGKPFSLQGYAAGLGSRYSFAAREVLTETLAG